MKNFLLNFLCLAVSMPVFAMPDLSAKINQSVQKATEESLPEKTPLTSINKDILETTVLLFVSDPKNAQSTVNAALFGAKMLPIACNSVQQELHFTNSYGQNSSVATFAVCQGWNLTSNGEGDASRTMETFLIIDTRNAITSRTQGTFRMGDRDGMTAGELLALLEEPAEKAVVLFKLSSKEQNALVPLAETAYAVTKIREKHIPASLNKIKQGLNEVAQADPNILKLFLHTPFYDSYNQSGANTVFCETVARLSQSRENLTPYMPSIKELLKLLLAKGAADSPCLNDSNAKGIAAYYDYYFSRYTPGQPIVKLLDVLLPKTPVKEYEMFR